jgi:heme/copper-type cytochrome/quinol oxidase subunit 2
VGDFNFLPLMLVVLVALIAMVTILFVIRGRRRKKKM